MEWENLGDETLIKKCVAKDTRATKKLYEKYGKLITIVASEFRPFYSNSVDEPTNIAWVKILNSIAQGKFHFNPKNGRLSSYLWRIARNAIIDDLKKGKSFVTPYVRRQRETWYLKYLCDPLIKQSLGVFSSQRQRQIASYYSTSYSLTRTAEHFNLKPSTVFEKIQKAIFTAFAGSPIIAMHNRDTESFKHCMGFPLFTSQTVCCFDSKITPVIKQRWAGDLEGDFEWGIDESRKYFNVQGNYPQGAAGANLFAVRLLGNKLERYFSSLNTNAFGLNKYGDQKIIPTLLSYCGSPDKQIELLRDEDYRLFEFAHTIFFTNGGIRSGLPVSELSNGNGMPILEEFIKNPNRFYKGVFGYARRCMSLADSIYATEGHHLMVIVWCLKPIEIATQKNLHFDAVHLKKTQKTIDNFEKYLSSNVTKPFLNKLKDALHKMLKR